MATSLSGFSPKNLSGFMNQMIPGLGAATGAISKVKGLGGNLTSMGMDLGNMESLVGACNPFEKKCGPPRIELFGGGGIGAIANGVINSVGKVVGVNMKDLGLGFTDPPKVRFVDDCGNGAGATGEAVIDPETGQLTNIIITDPGGGYLGADADSDGEDVVGFVSGIQVISTGAGYQEGDTITVEDTGAGPCTIIPQIFDGKIVGGSGPVSSTVMVSPSWYPAPVLITCIPLTNPTTSSPSESASAPKYPPPGSVIIILVS
jgi:hypothetical protein